MADAAIQSGATDELDATTVAGLPLPGQCRGARIKVVRREPSPFATLFPAEILRVTLDDGAELSLFLKHLGPEAAGQPDKERRDREPRVYQSLLCDMGLPVPGYIGSRRNAATGCTELYLEYVDDWSLRYQHLQHWVTAARRLAHLHAHFAARADVLRSCDFLLRLDGAYFAAWAARACAAVERQSSQLADRLSNTLGGYGRTCELLAAQPLTLVHNDLAPKNVLADRSTDPARICIVDWELAGAGCGLLDLVHLKYGLDAAADRDMVSAYQRDLGATHLLPEDQREFDRLLAACEAHKTLYRLAHSGGWNLPAGILAQWVGEVEGFVQRV